MTGLTSHELGRRPLNWREPVDSGIDLHIEATSAARNETKEERLEALTELEHKHGWDTSPPAARKAA